MNSYLNTNKIESWNFDMHVLGRDSTDWDIWYTNWFRISWRTSSWHALSRIFLLPDFLSPGMTGQSLVQYQNQNQYHRGTELTVIILKCNWAMGTMAGCPPIVAIEKTRLKKISPEALATKAIFVAFLRISQLKHV